MTVIYTHIMLYLYVWFFWFFGGAWLGVELLGFRRSVGGLFS